MESKRRTRYLIAIYTIVASISIILALVGINYAVEPFRSLILNLSTEFLGVALIFFLVNRLFLSEEDGLSERVEKLTAQLEKRTGFLQGVEDNEAFDQLAAESTEICLLGYTLIRLLKNSESLLIRRVNSGAIVRLLMVDPNSTGAKVIMENSEIKDFQNDFQIAVEYARRITKQRNNTKGRIEVRAVSWIPSCGMILLDPKQPSAYLRITIYPPCFTSPIDARAHFVLDRQTNRR